MASIVTFIILYGSLLTYLPLLLADSFAASPLIIGLLITVMSLVTIFTSSQLGKLAKKYGLYLIIDNSFATPYLQSPVKSGADLVVHSTTKFIDGQGRTIGGVIVGNKDPIQEIRKVSNMTGPSMSPNTAWILSKSLETLSVRMERHCINASSLAKYHQDQVCQPVQINA